MTQASVRLRKNEEQRIRAGHLWVYSNEIDTKITPLRNFNPGDWVTLEDHVGKPLGAGYINPQSLICMRLLSRDPDFRLTANAIAKRIQSAQELRDAVYSTPHYRLVFGESDFLPGLIIDRYGDICVVSLTTAGMDIRKPEIRKALQMTLVPKGIIWRNDSSIRALEGLEKNVETEGEIPEWLEINEGGCQFRVAALSGQKTGWFFDQQDNRSHLARYVKGKRVLDICSYVGGWGVRALHAGASTALCVDSSATALEIAEQNAVLNHVSDRLTTLQGDAFDVLKSLCATGEKFDVVIVDPPAFIKRRKDGKEGANAYRRLNELAMRLVARNGLLVSCSCSHHFDLTQLRDTLQASARHIDRRLQLLELVHQAVDHPLHPAIPETQYLKGYFARVLMA